MKTELLMSYYTPSRTNVRNQFIERAKKGAAVRGARLDAVESKAANKISMMAAFVKGTGSGRASASGESS
jgi:hypothetical protein